MFVWKSKLLSFVSYNTNKLACFPADKTKCTEVIFSLNIVSSPIIFPFISSSHLKGSLLKKRRKSSNMGKGKGNGNISNKTGITQCQYCFQLKFAFTWTGGLIKICCFLNWSFRKGNRGNGCIICFSVKQCQFNVRPMSNLCSSVPRL